MSTNRFLFNAARSLLGRRRGAVLGLVLGLITLGHGPSVWSATHAGSQSAVAATSSGVDDMGQRVTVPNPLKRIISLAPGATEMLFAAGAGPRLIATVDYSDEPPEAKRVPRIGDVTAVDMERLIALHPDVVVVWPGGGDPAQIEKLIRLGIPVYRQQVNALADLPASLRRLGALLGQPSVAERAADQLQAQLDRLAQQYQSGPHPTVFFQVWNRPLYTIGGSQLMSDSLRLCGARNVFADLREMSPVVSTEAVIARNPDIIIVAPPPGQGAAWLEDWQRFGSLRAVRSAKLLTFEDQRLSRLGPSVVSATAGLCREIAALNRGNY